VILIKCSRLLTEGFLTIPIMDPSGRTTVMSQHNGLRDTVAVNQQSYFQLHKTQSMAEADLEVKVTCRSKSHVGQSHM